MLKDRPEMTLATSNKGLQVFLQTVTLHCIVGTLVSHQSSQSISKSGYTELENPSPKAGGRVLWLVQGLRVTDPGLEPGP